MIRWIEVDIFSSQPLFAVRAMGKFGNNLALEFSEVKANRLATTRARDEKFLAPIHCPHPLSVVFNDRFKPPTNGCAHFAPKALRQALAIMGLSVGMVNGRKVATEHSGKSLVTDASTPHPMVEIHDNHLLREDSFGFVFDAFSQSPKQLRQTSVEGEGRLATKIKVVKEKGKSLEGIGNIVSKIHHVFHQPLRFFGGVFGLSHRQHLQPLGLSGCQRRLMGDAAPGDTTLAILLRASIRQSNLPDAAIMFSGCHCKDIPKTKSPNVVSVFSWTGARPVVVNNNADFRDVNKPTTVPNFAEALLRRRQTGGFV